MSVVDLEQDTPQAAPIERIPARVVQPPYQVIHGSTLTVDAPVGATTLVVDDGADFDDSEDGGGWLRLRLSADAAAAEDVYVEYTEWAGDETDVEYVTLAAPLAVAVPTGTMVDVWDPVDLRPDSHYECLVVLDEDNAKAFPVDVKQDVLDALPPDVTLGRGQTVTLERVDGEDDIDLVSADGDLIRDGNRTPLVVDATMRTTGQKGGVFRTDMVAGFAAEMGTNVTGGYFRVVNDVGQIVGLVQAATEDDIVRFTIGTAGDVPVRLRFRNSMVERVIEALTDTFRVFGLGYFNRLQLVQSQAQMRGFDVFTNAERTTDSNGIFQVVHNVNATVSLGQPVVKFGGDVGPSDVYIVFDGSEAGGILRFRVEYRSGANASRPDGKNGGDRANNVKIFFDLQVWSADR